MKVLVVDDSFVARRHIINALRVGGFPLTEVREAADGLEALAALANLPDLIVCDLNMPKMDGLKFLAAARQKFTKSQLRIVVLTARASAATAESVRRAGADLCLGKPFDPNDLVAKLKIVVGESELKP